MNRLRADIIFELLTVKGKNGLTKKELAKRLNSPKKNIGEITVALTAMKKIDEVKVNKKGVWRLKNTDVYFKAAVSDVNQRSGFITRLSDYSKDIENPEDKLDISDNSNASDNTDISDISDDFENNEHLEYFVRGKELHGAVPGDIVIAVKTEDGEEGKSARAAVIGVLEKSDRLFTGTIVRKGKNLMVYPDRLCDAPLEIAKISCEAVKNGDKVAFSIRKRGERHYEHMVEIKESFGSAENAKTSADAYMLVNGLHTEFPDEVLFETQNINIDKPDPNEIERRLDLRAEPIFTIDGADTKDIDDAVSISKTDGGYKLGVHIADVSHYVKKGSALDEEAFLRGTSIYYADKVVPMLPKELSNGICSLNPNVDRLAFSCLMEVSAQGALLSYRFEKTVIRSRVKGVYTEVNEILGDTANGEIKAKYESVIDKLPIMRELAEILYANRVSRGAPEIETPETKIVTDENGICTDVRARERGTAEKIIEEFMLMANKAAASLAMNEKIPFVYRIHEAPKPDKLIALAETLTALGADPERIGENSSAADLAEIIRKSRGTDRSAVINRIVLRTMMKAKYSDKPLGHYGLVMPEYAHFTSPIRRYADLSIHRILTDYVYGTKNEYLLRRYAKFAHEAAFRASVTELAAVNCERECESFYMAEFMKNHIGEEFDGFISGVTPNGIFVELPNTIEGMVSVSKLPAGDYEVQHNVILVGAANGRIFTVGDNIRVKCVSTSVSGGFIDFELAETEETPKIAENAKQTAVYNAETAETAETPKIDESEASTGEKQPETDITQRASSLLEDLIK